MNDNKNLPAIEADEFDLVEFPLGAEFPLSAGSPTRADFPPKIVAAQPVNIAPLPEIARSPSFKTLSQPELPTLRRENRARLQMQSPNRVFFYWSVASDPFRTLSRAITGPAGNYTLVLKLTDLKNDREEIVPIESEGSAWFDVRADGEYRAEIGRYAASRTFIRIMFSNTVRTPRRSPSPRLAETAEWRVSAENFSKALDAAGYDADAFDVAIAGDDPIAADAATHAGFAEFLGSPVEDFNDIPQDEMRYALLALASQLPLEAFRWRIGAELFALLQANAEKLSSERALSVLTNRFNIEAHEVIDKSTTAVYGSSLINFPQRLRRRRFLEPVNISSQNVSLR